MLQAPTMTKLFLIFLFILYFHHSNTSDTPYNIQKIVNEAGLFFHDIGRLRVSHDELSLLSFRNLTVYELKMNLIKTIFHKSVVLCAHPNPKINIKSNSQNFQCEQRLTALNEKIYGLNQKYETIVHNSSFANLYFSN